MSDQKEESKEPVQTLEEFLGELVDGVEAISDFMLRLKREKDVLKPEDQKELVYGAYSECLDLMADCKSLTSQLRKSYKVKEVQVKKWMKDDDSDSDDDDSKTEVKPDAKPTELIIENPLQTIAEAKPAEPSKPKRGRPPGKKIVKK